MFCGLSTGCAGFRNPFAPSGPPAPQVLRPGATLEEVVTAVNTNTARVGTYAANGATIRPLNMPGVPALSGGIMIERPSRFRVYAGTAFTGPEIDLGSNENLLWMWLARSEPPGVYICRRDQFAGSEAQQSMPIDPDWLPSALGLVEFGPSDQHELRLLPDQNLEVLSTLAGPNGVLTRVCVIDPTRAWVLQQHVYDANGTPLATALASDHRYFPEHQVSLPQRVEVRLPPAQLALAIDAGRILLNMPLGDAGQLWVPPQIDGYPQVNIGEPSGSSAAAPEMGSSGRTVRLPAPTAGEVLYVPKVERLPPSYTPPPGQVREPVYRAINGG